MLTLYIGVWNMSSYFSCLPVQFNRCLNFLTATTGMSVLSSDRASVLQITKGLLSLMHHLPICINPLGIVCKMINLNCDEKVKPYLTKRESILLEHKGSVDTVKW